MTGLRGYRDIVVFIARYLQKFSRQFLSNERRRIREKVGCVAILTRS